MTCIIGCGREPYAPPVCDSCRRRHRIDLRELAELWPLLEVDSARSISVSYAERVTGTPAASEPIRLDVVDLTLPGTGGTVSDPHGDQYGQVPIVARLVDYVDDIAEQMGTRKPVPVVPAMTGWLYARADWTADHYAAYRELHAEVWVSVLAVRRQLQISRGPRFYPIVCPSCTLVGTLRRDHGDDYIVCANCAAAMTADELLARSEVTADGVQVL